MLITAERMWLGPDKIRRGWGARVEGDRFVAVGPMRQLREGRAPGEEVLDYGQSCLMPGLVNAHCHLELGHLRERVPSTGGFSAWVRRLRQEDQALLQSDGPERHDKRIRQAIQLGAGELLSHGTTAVYDVSNGGIPAEILSSLPLRAYCALECLSLDPAKGPAVLERAANYLSGPQTTMLRRLAVPHALYSCSAWLLSELSGKRFHHGIPSIHLAESQEERDLLDQGMGALRTFVDSIFPDHDINPLEGMWGRLSTFYPPHAGMLVVHGYTLLPREIQLLADVGATLVLCPQSREFFANPTPAFEEIARRKLRVALGTDSLASGHALSLWREMAFLKALHPSLDSGIILSWATEGGARALGLEAGRLMEGRLADWLAADTADVPDKELEDYLVEQEPEVRAVGVGGCQVL
ncbi:MAG: Atrazine chlorohydrolase [Fibrobacterota bacterium]